MIRTTFLWCESRNEPKWLPDSWIPWTQWEFKIQHWNSIHEINPWDSSSTTVLHARWLTPNHHDYILGIDTGLYQLAQYKQMHGYHWHSHNRAMLTLLSTKEPAKEYTGQYYWQSCYFGIDMSIPDVVPISTIILRRTSPWLVILWVTGQIWGKTRNV